MLEKGTKNVEIYAFSLGKVRDVREYACVKDLTNIMPECTGSQHYPDVSLPWIVSTPQKMSSGQPPLWQKTSDIMLLLLVYHYYELCPPNRCAH